MFSRFSIRVAQDAQVIPSIGSSSRSGSGRAHVATKVNGTVCDIATVPELEEEGVAAGLGQLGFEGDCAGLRSLARVHVQVGEIIRADRDEVAVCAQVRLKPGDGTAATADFERQVGAAAQPDVVAVYGGRPIAAPRGLWRELAGHEDVASEHDLLAVHLEVGVHAPETGRWERDARCEAVAPAHEGARERSRRGRAERGSGGAAAHRAQCRVV